MDAIGDLILARFNYWVYVVIMMIGLYAMITKKNLIKKLIGMSIFQTAIILFFISVGVKEGATIPILSHEEDHETIEMQAGPHAADPTDHSTSAMEEHESVDTDDFANPLPHVLMLTAIVVGVATLGVGLAVVQRVFIQYGTLEEDEILKQIRSGDA